MGPCTLLPSFRCRSLSISLPLPFWPSASSSSLPLLCAILGMWLFLGVCAMVRCLPFGDLFYAFVCFALLRLAYFSVSAFRGSSHGFPCGFLSFLCPCYFSYITMLFVCFVSLSFRLRVGASGMGFTHLSLLLIIRHLRCCACAAIKPGALLLRLPPL